MEKSWSRNVWKSKKHPISTINFIRNKMTLQDKVKKQMIQ